VSRVTRKSYYQNRGDSEVRLMLYVRLAARNSLPNNRLESGARKLTRLNRNIMFLEE